MKVLLKYTIMFPLIFACSKNEQAEKKKLPVVAVAGNEELDVAQFRENFVSTGIIKDSLYNAKKSIENWASESLFYQEALTRLDEEEVKVEQEVQNYKKSLVNYIYQTRLIDANLDTNISKEEIEDYYNGHRENFILKENILKVNYFKVPAKAPALDKIKRLNGSGKPKDVEQLALLLSQNAENYFMNDSTWLYLDDIKKEIPMLKDQADYNLSPGRVLEFTDESYYYYLKVKDVKIKNGLSPLNFERKNIKKFITNNRKTQLITQYKHLLLEKAKASKTFVIK